MARDLVLLFIFTAISVLAGDEENLVFVQQDESTVKFSTQQNQELHQAVPVERDFSQHVKQKHTTPDGRNIFIYDGALNTSLLVTLRMFLTFTYGSWRYSIYESYEGGERKPGDNVPWTNDINIAEFSKTHTSRLLQKLVQETSGRNDQIWRPYKAQGKIIRRADYTHIHASTSEPGKEYTIAVFLTDNWRKNFYGELYLYDDHEEIIAGSVPHFGRTLVWDSSIPYLLRPPSFATGRGELVFFVHFTKDTEQISEHFAQYQNTIAAREHARQNWFTSPRPGIPNLDVHPNLVSEFSSSEGKKIFVFDELFAKTELDSLRGMIIRHGVYYYDDEEVDDSDNVQWIAGFVVDDYTKGYFWNITKQVLKFTSGGKDQWYPYDVSCNLIRSGDHTRIHHDCEPEEDEWTAILYLNPGMVHDDYGETIFYEKNSDDTEIITEVIPKYGRLVVFQGVIPHSARPPSAKFREARLTFVTKVSANEWVGRMKNLAQDKDHWVSLTENVLVLKHISTGGNAEMLLKARSAPSKKYPKGSEEDDDDDEEEEEEMDRGGIENRDGGNNDRQEMDDERQEKDDGGQEGSGEGREGSDERLERDDDQQKGDASGNEETTHRKEIVQDKVGTDGGQADRDGAEQDTAEGKDQTRAEWEIAKMGGEGEHPLSEEVNMFLEKISTERENDDQEPQRVKALQDELETRQKDTLGLAFEDIFDML